MNNIIFAILCVLFSNNASAIQSSEVSIADLSEKLQKTNKEIATVTTALQSNSKNFEQVRKLSERKQSLLQEQACLQKSIAIGKTIAESSFVTYIYPVLDCELYSKN